MLLELGVIHHLLIQELPVPGARLLLQLDGLLTELDVEPPPLKSHLHLPSLGKLLLLPLVHCRWNSLCGCLSNCDNTLGSITSGSITCWYRLNKMQSRRRLSQMLRWLTLHDQLCFLKQLTHHLYIFSMLLLFDDFFIIIG